MSTLHLALPPRPVSQRQGHPLPGLVRAPRALLVVDRGFALVVVAEVWAAAAAAASVARFCNCNAFMPAGGRERARQQQAHLTRFPKERAGDEHRGPWGWHTHPAALRTRAVPHVPYQPRTLCPTALSWAAQLSTKNKQEVSVWTTHGRAFHCEAVTWREGFRVHSPSLNSTGVHSGHDRRNDALLL